MFAHETHENRVGRYAALWALKRADSIYTRASFAALIRLAKHNIDANWEQVICMVAHFSIHNVEEDSVTRGFNQELRVYLHTIGLFPIGSIDLPERSPLQFVKSTFGHSSLGRLQTWKTIPPLVTITIEIPKSNLEFRDDHFMIENRQPPLSFAVTEDGPTGWSELYSALYMAFGRIDTRLDKDSGRLVFTIEKDDAGIQGTAPLIISGIVPTWLLLKDPTALVSVRLIGEPGNPSSYRLRLGAKLTFFETKLSNEKAVYVSVCLPERRQPVVQTLETSPFSGDDSEIEHVAAMPILSGRSAPDISQIEYSDQSLATEVMASNGSLTTVSCRLSVKGAHATELAKPATNVTMKALSPIEVQTEIGSLKPLTAKLKLPVKTRELGSRVARKSSYVEAVGPVAQLPAQVDEISTFPISLQQHGSGLPSLPVCLTVPYIDLDGLPILDVAQTENMKWLTTHLGLMFSPREYPIREASIPRMLAEQRIVSDDVRVAFKESLASIFMHASGIGRQRVQAFSMFRWDVTGAGAMIWPSEVLLFVSPLRLDIANRTVVLDAAVLPLTSTVQREPLVEELMAVKGLFGGNSRQVRITSDVMHIWKAALPAFAERCRTCSHKVSCEYSATGHVPLPAGVEREGTPICSCGEGEIPHDFMGATQVPQINKVPAKFATRIAISPCFAMPYTEYCFRATSTHHNPTDIAVEEGGFLPEHMCGRCWATERVDKNGAVKPLFQCSRCGKAKYCSPGCQKAHWKEHKKMCKAGPSIALR